MFINKGILNYFPHICKKHNFAYLIYWNYMVKCMDYYRPAEDKILNVKPEFVNDRSLEYPMAEAYPFKRLFFICVSSYFTITLQLKEKNEKI